MRKIALLTLFLGFAGFAMAQSPANCGTPQNPCWIGGAQPPAPKPRLWPEVAVDAVWAGSAAVDVGLSQSCIQAGTCYEGNRLMASSAAGASVMEFGETAGSMWLFHHFRKHYPKLAWIIPGVNIGMHAASIIHIEYVRSNLPVKGQR